MKIISAFGFASVIAFSTTFCQAQVDGWDTTVVANYPVWGTWTWERGDTCAWKNILEPMHRIGMKAVLTFGYGIEKIPNTGTNPTRADMADCPNCFDNAKTDLAAINPSNVIANWLIYAPGVWWYSDQIMTCPALDKKIVVTLSNGTQRTYWRIVLPHTGTSDCNFNGGTYDVLFTSFDGTDASKDPTDAMLYSTEKMGMEAYPGMPSIPSLSNGWQVDMDIVPPYYEWSSRVLKDWGIRFGNRPSFKGVYQGYEAPLDSDPFWLSVYDIYGQAASSLHAKIPGKKLILSPYMVQVIGGGSVATIKEGFKELAGKGVDIIAPQDGRGSEKGAYYFPFQINDKVSDVDPRLAADPSVPSGATFGSRFPYPIDETVKSLRDATEELKSEAINLDFWMNMESQESGTRSDGVDPELCFFYPPLASTKKSRLDFALTHMAAYPSKIISFMWDGLFTCATSFNGGKTLADTVLTDATRPIASEAFRWPPGGNSLVVRGFNLATPGTKFELFWYNAAWKDTSIIVTMNSPDPNWGAQNNRSPLLQEVYVPFDWADMAPNFYVHITPQSPAGVKANYTYSMQY